MLVAQCHRDHATIDAARIDYFVPVHVYFPGPVLLISLMFAPVFEQLDDLLQVGRGELSKIHGGNVRA